MLITGGCSTTTVHTGSDYPYENPGASADESDYFVPMSERDAAYRGKDDPEEEKTDDEEVVAAKIPESEKNKPESECSCPVNKENRTVVADRTATERNTNTYVATQSEESYFNQITPQNEDKKEQPVIAGNLNQNEDQQDASWLDNLEEDPVQSDTAVIPVVAGNTNNNNMVNDGFTQTGTASWYGRDFDGRPTASGEIFDSRKLTAAHKSLPLGSIVLVRNLENGKEILVTVNDRGPFVTGRILDVSEYGAELLGYKNQGLTRVGLRLIRKGDMKKERDGLTQSFFDESGGQGGDDSGMISYDKIDENIDRESDIRGYSVQVGVFGEYKNAHNMKNFLKEYGVPVRILKRDGNFVVKVGDFSSRYGAEQLKYQLVSDGYPGFISEPQ